MTHPIRSLIKIVELQDTKTGGDPPTLLDEPGGRRPEGGKYWFHAGQKIIVPPHSDFAIQPMEQYQQFGFNPRDMLAWFEQHNKVAANELQRHLKDPAARIFGNLGTRSGCIMYAIVQGWAYIEYEEQGALIWLDGQHARQIVHAAGSLFPMMGMEVIKLVLPREGDAFTNRAINFRKEDYAGFAGAYGAVMQWVKDGTVPQQDWTYTLMHTGDVLDAAGLHAKPMDYARKGGWTDRKIFGIPYFGRRGAISYFGQQKGGTIFRFPTSVAVDLGLDRGQFVNDEVLYSKKPFVIPAAVLQRKTGSGWEMV